MDREILEKIERHACKNLRDFAEDGFSAAADTEEVKNLMSICCKVCELKGSTGHSGDGYWEARGSYGDDGMGGNGMNTYRRRSRSNTTGRYMADGRDEMREHMERMIRSGDLSPDEEREAKRFMQMLDKA